MSKNYPLCVACVSADVYECLSTLYEFCLHCSLLVSCCSASLCVLTLSMCVHYKCVYSLYLCVKEFFAKDHTRHHSTGFWSLLCIIQSSLRLCFHIPALSAESLLLHHGTTSAQSDGQEVSPKQEAGQLWDSTPVKGLGPVVLEMKSTG